LTCLPDFASQEHFVNDSVHLVEIKDQVQLADVVEVFVQYFDEIMNCFQVHQIVILDVDAYAKVEPRVPPVHDLEVSELHEVGVFCISDRNDGMNFFDQLLLLVVVKIHVPFR